MSVRSVKLPDEAKQAFELGYLAAVIRLRRELPTAWQNAMMGALLGESMDRENLAEATMHDGRYGTHVRGMRLIVLRCEAAATMLSWRKGLSEKSRTQLREALGKLTGEAERLGVY